MINDKVSAFCFDNCIRIDKIIWLAGLTDAASDDFRDLLDDLTNLEFFELVDGKMPEYVQDCNPDELIQELPSLGLLGFLVQVSTPVVEKDGRRSWGYCKQKWLYVESLDEVMGLMKEWQDSLAKKAKKKGKTKP